MFRHGRPGHGNVVRAFKLTEVESWPQCLEILIEGEVDIGVTELFGDALGRAVDLDHLFVMVDLDRCEFIDIVAVKLLVVAQAQLSSRGQKLLIFGATGQVRRLLEAVEAFDSRVLVADAGDSPRDHEPFSSDVPPEPQDGRGRAALSRLLSGGR